MIASSTHDTPGDDTTHTTVHIVVVPPGDEAMLPCDMIEHPNATADDHKSLFLSWRKLRDPNPVLMQYGKGHPRIHLDFKGKNISYCLY